MCTHTRRKVSLLFPRLLLMFALIITSYSIEKPKAQPAHDGWGYPWHILLNVYRRVCERTVGTGRACLSVEEAAKYHVEDGCSKICNLKPIQKCTCVEMILRSKTMKPLFPLFNGRDLKKHFKKASVCYHPDKNQQAAPHAQAFLAQCVDYFQNRVQYRAYTHAVAPILEKCSHENEAIRLTETQCRHFIMELNSGMFSGEEQPIPADTPQHNAREGRRIVVLDNSLNVDELTKAHKDFQKISYSLSDFQTSVHIAESLLEFKKSRQIHSEDARLEAEILSAKIFSVWKGGGDGTYVWQYIWNLIKPMSSDAIDGTTEIILFTNGRGPTRSSTPQPLEKIDGFNGMMENIKAKFQIIPRITVFCYSTTCKQTTTRDLTQASGGLFCTPEDIENCAIVLSLPGIVRDHVTWEIKQNYLKQLQSGEAKLVSWSDAIEDVQYVL